MYTNGHKCCIYAHLKCVTHRSRRWSDRCFRMSLWCMWCTCACSHLNATDRSLDKTLIWAWRGIKICHSVKQVFGLLRLFSSQMTSPSQMTSSISSTLCTNSGTCFQKKRMRSNFLAFPFAHSHSDLFLDDHIKTKFS